jgi:hypothetical protein
LREERSASRFNRAVRATAFILQVKHRRKKGIMLIG